MTLWWASKALREGDYDAAPRTLLIDLLSGGRE